MYFTKRQLEVLDFIRRFRADQRLSPTLEEIADHFRVSKVTILEHVRRLESKGVLRRTPNQARSIELIEEAAPSASDCSIPIVGELDPGAPSRPFDLPGTFDLQRWLEDVGNLYLLRIRGDALVPDGLRDGDLLLVHRRRRSSRGAWIILGTPDGALLLRRHDPSRAPADVRGSVLGVIRPLDGP